MKQEPRLRVSVRKSLFAVVLRCFLLFRVFFLGSSFCCYNSTCLVINLGKAVEGDGTVIYRLSVIGLCSSNWKQIDLTSVRNVAQ